MLNWLFDTTCAYNQFCVPDLRVFLLSEWGHGGLHNGGRSPADRSCKGGVTTTLPLVVVGHWSNFADLTSEMTSSGLDVTSKLTYNEFRNIWTFTIHWLKGV